MSALWLRASADPLTPNICSLGASVVAASTVAAPLRESLPNSPAHHFLHPALQEPREATTIIILLLLLLVLFGAQKGLVSSPKSHTEEEDETRLSVRPKSLIHCFQGFLMECVKARGSDFDLIP